VYTTLWETTFCVWRHVIFPFIHQRLLCFVSHSNGMTSCQSSSTENVSCNVAQFFITTVSVIDHFHISDFDSKIILFTWVFPLYYILSSNKGIFVWPIWPEVNSIFSHPGKITGYWITTRSFPYRGPYWPGPIWASTLSQAMAPANMGLDFVSGQYECLFSRCRKYVLHGHFHIGLVIIPRPILSLGPIWRSRDDNQANMEMPMY
jgi:hypothetical protein